MLVARGMQSTVAQAYRYMGLLRPCPTKGATVRQRSPLPHPARFWEKVEPASGASDRQEDWDAPGCWEWRASCNDYGYGQYSLRRRMVKAHRVAYELHKGPIPDSLDLDHKCRNRRCVRPDHLEPVTTVVNTLRGEAPSAQNKRKTHCKNGHAFTPENTYVTPRGTRNCRTCHRERSRADYTQRIVGKPHAGAVTVCSGPAWGFPVLGRSAA